MEIIEKQLRERFNVGMKRYGHGVIIDSDTRNWGTPRNSWIDMAVEEFLDAVIYIVADYVREWRTRCPLIAEYTIKSEDDNGLIIHIIHNYTRMESPKHKMLVWNLINMIYTCSIF